MLNGNGTALAQTGTPLSPLYVTWFFGNGTLPGLWKPAVTGVGTQWALSPQLQPLADFKSDLTVVSGLENRVVVIPEHPSGSAGATTGAPLSGNAVRAKSIDQVVADLISTGAPFRSLELGVTPATPGGPEHSLHTVSHSGPNARNNPEFDPRAVFDRLFMDTSGPNPDAEAEEQAAKLARARTSVLDAIEQDGTSLQLRLGSADRARVEAHLEAIRAIERRIETIPGEEPVAVECGSLTPPTVGPDMQSEAPPEVNSAMAELATLALACEKTRVLTFMFSLPAAHVYYRHLASNMNDDFHDTICHGDEGDESSQARVDTGVLYTMQCLGEFLTNLKNTPHGSTNLLDSTLVYVTSDTAWGKIHTNAEWPVLFVGKAGGRLRGDEHHNFQGDNLSKALLTAARIMGSTATEIGMDAGRVTEPLAGVQA
ncbi:MAG TPA: DUF1552 domain-containing protein [Polyangiaceae bacterium]